jgi:LmbE family N-acetylglucosaminyl deacetylase
MKVLVIAVHPDDETLGCGGALLNYAAQGNSLHWLVVTASHEPEYSSAQGLGQVEQVHAVERAYPFATLDWLKFPTTRLERVPFNDLVRAIRAAIERLRPEIVFVPNRSDVHSDHRIAFQAAMAVLKSFYMRSLRVRRVLACEVLSETDAAPPLAEHAFVPNVFVDVSTTLKRKLEIMGLYKAELQPDPFPRSPSAIRALARYRGATIGVEYAEAFMLVREVS